MQEFALTRSIRREFSRQLTKLVNDAKAYPAVRVTVLNSLSELWGRLLSLVEMLRQDLQLDPSKPLLYFYMKGGNAFECVIDPNGPAAIENGGGDSDWDTQIVVDPWAPLPLQNHIYALLEDLVLDELRNCAIEIAKWNPEIGESRVMVYQDEKAGGPEPQYMYELSRDDQQTIRQVFDHRRTGLWLNTSRKLSDRSMPGAELPGLIFNAGIEPFLLFRLGYTWHAEPMPWPNLNLPGAAKGPSIERPMLMELIDVTLPRRNTVEAVEVWEELQSDHMRINPTNVMLQHRGETVAVMLPLPSLNYHFAEQALMLSEVAADVSKSVNKVMSRFNRLERIYLTNQAAQSGYRDALAAMAGVSADQLAQMPDRTTPSALALNQRLVDNKAGEVLQAPNGSAKYLALSMMYRIADRRIVYQDGPSLAGRYLLNQALGELRPPLAEAAASDDLALHSTVRDNGYFDPGKFPASGIDMAAWLRVDSPAALAPTAASLCNSLPGWLAAFAARAGNAPSPQIGQWITNTFANKAIRVVRRDHTTMRSNGMSHEATLVVFADGRAVAVITLTGAVPGEAPFLPDTLPNTKLASVVDMAEQRKVAAAVIKDFYIRNVLSKQLRMLEWMFPSIWQPDL
ncbi:hypothetical protein [Burkholderia plantarii]|uniref:hypothetical protein n=1 Tax=Burkholderia plantarii TaxID=41899 RepID=UPI0018DC5C7E|nr:hypothetical protein [Burkholderia plantarii]MBI0328922.1 hypothetical protein [Burkholderia plantarii]